MVLKRPLIITIDDDVFVRTSIFRYLEDLDYRVLEADGGQSGLELIQDHSPDLILVDLRMPGVNGLDVLSWVTQNQPNIPIIVISGTGMIADVIEALRQGAWDYLLKPISNFSILKHAIEKSLERARLIRENITYQKHLETQVTSRTEELKNVNFDLQQLNQRLKNLVKTTQNISTCLHFKEFGTNLLIEFSRHLDSLGGSFYLMEKEGLRLIHSLDPGHSPELLLFPLDPASIFATLLKLNEPLLITEKEKHQFTLSGWDGYMNSSTLAFPLKDDTGATIGVVSLHNKKNSCFTEQDKEIGSILASYSSEAIGATLAKENQVKSEEMFRMVFEASKDAMITVDDQGIITMFNPAAECIFDYHNSEMLGQNLERLIPYLYQKNPDQPEGLLQIADDKTLEVSALRKSGEAFPIELSCSQGKIDKQSFVFLVIRDISKRKLAEREKSHLEEQLQQAVKMESIGHLAGNIAHDFNNMLSPILGYTDLMLFDLDPNDPNHSDLMEIHRASKKAKKLAQQLLTFSRTQEFSIKTINIDKIISDLENILRQSIREDVQLTLNLNSSKPIHGNRSKIEQILMNLVVNAQDAMPNGGHLTIKTKEVILDNDFTETCPDLKPGQYTLLDVSDTGIGIDLQTAKHIFEPFFTTKKVGEGTGLGLSSVYGLVKQHNGHITVEGKPQKGARFKIFFPVNKQKINSQSLDIKTPRNRTGNETILVVEDNKEVRELVATILTRHGYSVILSEDLEGCLNLSEEQKGKSKLLLTDVVMPQMNGKELYEQLTEPFPDLKVLYMSGYTNDIVTQYGIAHNATNFIQKPLSVTGLTLKIREILDIK